MMNSVPKLRKINDQKGFNQWLDVIAWIPIIVLHHYNDVLMGAMASQITTLRGIYLCEGNSLVNNTSVMKSIGLLFNLCLRALISSYKFIFFNTVNAYLPRKCFASILQPGTWKFSIH